MRLINESMYRNQKVHHMPKRFCSSECASYRDVPYMSKRSARLLVCFMFNSLNVMHVAWFLFNDILLYAHRSQIIYTSTFFAFFTFIL